MTLAIRRASFIIVAAGQHLREPAAMYLGACTRALILFVGLGLLSACTSNRSDDFNTQPSIQNSEPAAPPAPAPQDDGQYRLMPGDKLSVNVFGEPQLSGDFPVAPDGTATLPQVGQVPAAGRTVTDIQNELVGRYSATVSNPQILVSVINATQ
jgi:protein involved in polysaccharide export with SLBB domain